MIDHGRRILTAEVGGWYDAGKLDTLLESNEILLKKGAARRPELPGVKVNEPVLVADGATVEGGEIGPNVTIEAGATVKHSRLRHTIVGEGARVLHSDLNASMLGDHSLVEGLRGSVTIGDHSEVVATRP